MMMMMHPIVTETPNHITRNLDVAGPRGIVRLLRQCDAQIFSGWEDFVSLNDAPFLRVIEELTESIQQRLKRASSSYKVKIIMSGAGTSGRLAFFCSRTLNKISKRLNSNLSFDYLMAGNDVAIMKSVEKAEDDVIQSVEDLKKKSLAGASNHVVYIGITCGLSAPYVGSQLDWILNQADNDDEDNKSDFPTFTTILMGFNDPSAARKVPIEGWHRTMHDVVSQLQSKVGDGRHFLLTPIIGPEPVTGSTRMKSGTTTKLLIEALAAALFQRHHGLSLVGNGGTAERTSFAELFSLFERVNRATYLAEEQLAEAVAIAGEALRHHDGHLYYLAEEPLSLLGLIDASECPPTYGALFSDVRGFIIGGWQTMANDEGDLSHIAPHFRISDEDFQSEIVPNLSAHDVIVILHAEGQPTMKLEQLISKARAVNPQQQFVLAHWTTPIQSPSPSPSLPPSSSTSLELLINATGNNCCLVKVGLPFHELVEGSTALLEMSVKWVLNAISTGAHVLKGKVYSNRMIDLCLSNNKLYFRGIAMLASLMNIDNDFATVCIQRAIHERDAIDSEIANLPISKHYEKAITRERVIPISILLASGRFSTVHDAKLALNSDPILRNLLLKFLSPNN